MKPEEILKFVKESNSETLLNGLAAAHLTLA